jgi:osmoprotectant transport system permease protein
MTGLWSLFKTERWALAAATAAHLDLVLEALVVAVAIGVPLGILASRSRTTERIVLGLANTLQTVPSLALLGFLLIVFGGAIGKPPALTALVIYSLLPIIKNTILGLKGLDPGIAEAAVGMGMTPWQRLTLVELPLAVPVVLGGVRVATVAAVGMATIAAAIGAKGLGSYIFRGVSLSDSRLILLGSIPAALLALACDAALAEVEHALDPSTAKTSRVRPVLATLAILGLIAVAGWGAWGDRPTRAGQDKPIVIGSKDGAEMILLGHMLADLVEAETGLRVDRRFNLGGTLVCFNASKQGGLDAYVEYTGTALTTILKEPPDNDPRRVLDRVRTSLQRDGVTCLDPFGFENTFAILMRRSDAARQGIRTISDAARHASTIRPGFGPEFMNRPDGLPGLTRAYGLSFAETPREMDRNLLYQALAKGSIDLAAGDSTDGRIAALDLVSLEDDRRYFPPYEAVPLVRTATLSRHPKLRAAFGRLAGQISAETMRALNQEVDGKHKDAAEVARNFLRERGLLGPRKSGPQ